MKKNKISDPVQNHIKRLWGGLPVIDGEHDLRVFINQSDLDNAVRKDPGACVFAAACKRIFGSSKVLFFKSVAYVDLPDGNGARRVERFEMPDKMRELIEAFDRGEMTIPEAGFLLKVPKASFTLEYRRNISRKTRKRAALLKGTASYPRKVSRPILIDMSVRNGTGMTHFIKMENKEKAVNV
jgi:hypothetical protein